MATIRFARSADVAALAPLMADFTTTQAIVWQPAAVAAAFAHLCGTPELGFSLLAEDLAPIGYIVVTYSFDLEFAGRDAFVTELYVAPAARRSGLAATLLAAAEAEARRHDVRALHLVTAPDNEVAQAVYRRAGFTASPRIMMTKPLDP